ncbi:sodium:alanine symporter family protein [Enterobacter bugandensis]|jgi:AGCS family alanine or glycine:cation symporter|uniref:alanine/glycine:cation symporter family protein n=1 Tax=Enterobacter TaxID=547 RepID=UPI0015F68254|nr:MULTISPECIES: sodium:alanine symporter family protein [Enterobacter]EKS7115766.1 sodium:alanine symporter family protein [Enterobacter bugandensis]ELK6538015.1 sodium:alanine symporter family protein [Enterobacter bugandensis]MBE4833146.1 sodium:alanine symporter family protein [Enterobacter cloacae complex sp. P47BA]MBF2749716.1 sodium:alanine symporter family protein [Enterobacter bugandensis]MBF2801920.1 sodium:alanine symporter family protein [Enterobacter bugandensis]
MPDFLFFINEVLWGSIMIYLLLGAGIWFTLRSGFIQFRYIRKFGRSLKNSVTPQPGGLTSFQALCTSLAARLGSGNLAGVALAISAGGPGAVFWMWVTALLGMATSFAESSLAQLYKEKDRNGQFRGGPAWYMARGLGMRWMGVLFSLFLLLAYGLIFNTVQSNSVAHALRYTFSCPEWITGIGLALFVLLTISAGLKGVARIMQWLVPIMALLWVAASLVVAALHADQVPGVIATIFKSAFGWREVASGALGYTLSQALMAGFQRGMFSNEAGMGSTPNAAAAASSWPPHPAAQGIVQMIGVFMDTVIICSASAMILLLAGPVAHDSDIDGIQLLQQALVNLTGGWGSGFVSLILMLFAFSSIVVNYLYAENNLIFLKYDSRPAILLLRLGVVLMVIAGSLLNMPLVWQLADVIMALMAITNLTAILLLSPVVNLIARDYLRQRKLGVPPVFDAARYPEIQSQLAPGTWDDLPRR